MSYSAPANTHGCWTLAIRCIRERMVRAGQVEPINDDERRQAKEGQCGYGELDALK